MLPRACAHLRHHFSISFSFLYEMKGAFSPRHHFSMKKTLFHLRCHFSISFSFLYELLALLLPAERDHSPPPLLPSSAARHSRHVSCCGYGLLHLHTAYVSIRQHTSAYDSINIRQYLSAYVSKDTRVTPAAAAVASCLCIRPHTSACVIGC